ncbi:MAG: hypothetical protein ACTTKL_09825 [Treponema sp.]
MNRKKGFFTAAAFLLCAAAWANIFSTARRVYVLKTAYFDIIFPKKCSGTAYKLAKSADGLFEKAANELGLKEYFRMPVVISPDSETLFAEYTPSPYNRIVIYDALPSAGSYDDEDALTSEFYREVLRAAASSIRDPFWQTVSQRTSNDFIQPVTMLNIPYAFMEGTVNTLSNAAGIQSGRLSIRLLSQAKAEGKFPSWLDALGSRDTHPESFADEAGTAFAAFLQQKYGMEKFAQFFQESGKVHFFQVTAGIFKRVYGAPIEIVWADFVQSIPVFPSIEEGEPVIAGNERGLYTAVRAAKNGVFFYDEARNQVSVTKDGKKPQFLFTATGVSGLEISPNGAYAAISFTAGRTQKNLSVRKAKVFNVKRRLFEGTALSMRSVSFATRADGTLALTGITDAKGLATLSAYPLFAAAGTECVFSHTFERGAVPAAAVSVAPDKILCPVYCGRACSLESFDIGKRGGQQTAAANGARKTPSPKANASPAAGAPLRKTLPVRAYDFKKAVLNVNGGAQDAVMFTYEPEENGKPAAAGFVLLDKDTRPAELYLQHSVYSGGCNNAAVFDGTLYFVSRKYDSYELKQKPFDISEFTKTDFIAEPPPQESADESIQDIQIEEEEDPKIEKRLFLNLYGDEQKAKFLNEYRLYRYNPFPYMFKGSWLPFSSISSLTLEKSGYILAPSLGFTYVTNTDPLEQNKGVISFGAGFLDPKDNYRLVSNDFNLSAYYISSHFPVDIITGGNWAFTKEGGYRIQALLGASWNIPLGMNFHKTVFTADFLWNCRTEYNDTEKHEKIVRNDWTPLANAFHFLDFTAGLEYSNYRRHGFSAYEMLGFSLQGAFVYDYDFRKLFSARSKGYSSDPTQILFNWAAGLKLPYLIPVHGIENWILCLPLTVSTEWKLKDGTVSNSFAEIVLAGYEIQRGIPRANLYLRRGGIKLGYDVRLKYNELAANAPDARNINYFALLVKSSDVDDFIYSNVEFEFSPLLGNFSKTLKITAGVRFEHHLKTGETKANAILKMNI